MEVPSSPVPGQVASEPPHASEPKAKESQTSASHSLPSFQPNQVDGNDSLTIPSDEIRPDINQDSNGEIVNGDSHDQCREKLGKFKKAVDLKREGIKEQASIGNTNRTLHAEVSNAHSTLPRGNCNCTCHLHDHQPIGQARRKRCTFLPRMRQCMLYIFSFFLAVIVPNAKRFYNGVRDVATEVWKLAKEEAMECAYSIPAVGYFLIRLERERPSAYSWFIVGSETANAGSSGTGSRTWDPEEPSSWGYSNSTDVRIITRQNLVSPCEPIEKEEEVERMSSVAGNYVHEIKDLREPGDTSGTEQVKSSALEDDEIKPVILPAKAVSPEPKHTIFAQDNVAPDLPKTNVHEVPSEKHFSMALKSVQVVRAKVVHTSAGVRSAARSLFRPLQRFNHIQFDSHFFSRQTTRATTARLETSRLETARLAKHLTHKYGCNVHAARRRHVWKIHCDRVNKNGTVLRVKLVVQPSPACICCIVTIYPARNSSGIRDVSREYVAFVASLRKTFFTKENKYR